MTTKRALTGAEASPRPTKKSQTNTASSVKLVNTAPLMHAMASSFNDPSKYPDLTITCSGRTWHCHKVVLTACSDWFKTACAGRFKEGGAATIAVEEENLDAFGAMLGFCYGLDPNVTAPLSVHFSAQLFGLGEKYFVEGLTEAATGYFKTALRSGYRTKEDLSAGITEAYDYTSDVNKVLRNTIKEAMMEKDEELMRGSHESFYHQLLDSIPEFAADMAKTLLKSKTTTPPKDGDQGGKGPGWYRCLQGTFGPARGCAGTIYSAAVLNSADIAIHSLECLECHREGTLMAQVWKGVLQA